MSSGGTSLVNFQSDTDVHISFEDQQKINKFANLNAKFEDLKDELKTKGSALQNLEDAVSEIELADDDVKIPFLIGELFINQSLEKTKESLDEARSQLESEIKDIEKRCSDISEIMSDLKVKLIARFGNHINLEPDDD